MTSSSISRRVEALETIGGAKDTGVAGIVLGRGAEFDPVMQQQIDREIAALQAAGHSVVYVANLAGPRPPNAVQEPSGPIT